MNEMTEKEMINNLINEYANLQRIQKSNDPEKELANQLKIAKAKLQSLGIPTEDLEIN